MIRKILSCFLVLFATSVFAQTTAHIVDAASGESIPYATISYGSEHLISNADGAFTVPASVSDDTSLTISFLGYSPRKLSVAELKRNTTIKMEVGVYELQDVSVTKPDANTIIAQMRANLKSNYENRPLTKNRIFMRSGTSFRPEKIDLEVTKSTGFTKKALELTNKEIAAFTSSLKRRPPKSYTDRLFDYHIGNQIVDGKPVRMAKMEMIKAVKLADENNSTDLEVLQETAIRTLLKHIDTTKYYRFKSGWFGSRDTISLRQDQKKKKQKKEVENSRLNAAKGEIMGFFSENSVVQNRKFDFIHAPEDYEYKYEGAVYSDQDDWVYVVSFRPDRRRAKFSGKLYISQSDFAIVRMDYALEEGKKLESFNLKLLLGVKFAQNVSKRTLIYRKDPAGEGYYLHYASEESGMYFYINRPLKFIELTDEDRDVVAFDFKVEGNSLEKTEYLNLSRTPLDQKAFDQLKETEFQYQVLKRYDPNVWKNVGAIEPLQEMKQYQATE